MEKLFYPAESPAFSGFFPTLRWQPLSKNKSELLQQTFEGFSTFEVLKSTKCYPLGYYRAIKQEENCCTFIKITSLAHGNKLIAAEAFTTFLSTTITTSVFNRHGQCHLLDQTYAYFEYPYQELTLPTCNKENIKSVATTVAKMHLKLKSFPNDETVEKNHTLKLSSLYDLQKRLYCGSLDISGIPKENQRLALLPLPEVLKKQSWHQIIHGDLNTGNILFDSDQAVILDFEDTIQTYSCPWQDISFCIERFIILPCINQSKNEEDICRDIGYFLDCYDRICPLKNYAPYHSTILGDWLVALSLKANLLLIQQCVEFGHTVTPNEWQKFTYLHQLANDNALLWSNTIQQWHN